MKHWLASGWPGECIMSAYCSNCGNALPPMARFCSNCGAAISGAPPVGFPPQAPRLVRPIFGRQFAGVCAGLARTYCWDVATVRVLAVVGGIFLCPVVEVLYIACWIGIPEEPIGEMQQPQQF
jgi:phage shock protein C